MSVAWEARHYLKREKRQIHCELCPHNCVIYPGRTGICGARRNENGTLITDIYGRISSMAMDPIEKKPLYHFYPGREILSIGTRGCNFKCPYCQNWQISQDMNARTAYHTPEQIAAAADERNSIGIAYTYSEPMIWFEYVMDTGLLARERGLKNIMVTNGFINRAPLSELLTLVDAMNIDLKAFREDTYREVNKGRLKNVLDTVEQSAASGCHVEVTTLIVTGMNDSMEEMRGIIDFIASVNPSIPWHISRYFPNYRYDREATDVSFITEVYREAKKKLHFVYCGNVSIGSEGSDTVCPKCGVVVINRSGYFTSIKNLKDGSCSECGENLGIMQ